MSLKLKQWINAMLITLQWVDFQYPIKMFLNPNKNTLYF